jgi:AAA15 family ATPase/GTPase
MHLKSLVIKNFRCLEDFEVKKLGHVNLIVGKNNSGKSTVLEALRIYAGNANRDVLEKISKERNEYYDPQKDNPVILYKNIFTGRKFPEKDKQEIIIGTAINNKNILKIEHIYIYHEDISSINDSGDITSTRKYKKISKNRLEQHNLSVNTDESIQISKNENHYFLDQDFKSQLVFSLISDSIFVSFLPTYIESENDLANQWDKIALTPYEDKIINLTRKLEEKILAIRFVKSEGELRHAVIRLRDQPDVIPLGSMGDGMRRILQLGLKASLAQNSFLLIDEFENGLHYSIQEKIWGWLFDLAKEMNIQIFATTHSWDCIEAFTKVANEKKNIDGVLFRVGRSVRDSDNGRVIATEYDEEKLARLTQKDFDIR